MGKRIFILQFEIPAFAGMTKKKRVASLENSTTPPFGHPSKLERN
jgi:hypothetical protein